MAIRLRIAQTNRGRVWRHGRITFSRAAWGAAGWLLLAALPLAGCAPAQAPAAGQPQASGPAGPDYATIAAIRPIPPAGTGSGIDPQAEILAAMGVPPAPAAPPAAEIILRRDDGNTLSVVERGAAALTPGERVMVQPGDGGPRLVPLAPAS
jgi:outer membrane lipoprotein SlyB